MVQNKKGRRPGSLRYVKHTPISLKNHPEFDEKWLSDRIVEDPPILGLGDVEVRDVERIQPRAGRLDLLLSDSEIDRRYEVEIMLGTVNESHIIRTIEYWDVERKRYPQYDHCAVIVAEEITTRFLNVIALFNNSIPLIAIQLSAIQVGQKIVLSFTTVLDEIIPGDDVIDGISVDRNYWKAKASAESMAVADECLTILQEIEPSLKLSYKKHYIGLVKAGRIDNFVIFRPKKQVCTVEAYLKDKEAWKSRLKEAALDVMPVSPRHPRLRFRASQDEITKTRELLREFFETSYKERQE